jgi:2-phospho-L-lactate guanylyltransferase
MMKTVVVVPVKDLARAKSRLGSTLSTEERAQLTLDLLQHVLEVIEGSGVVDCIALISPDPQDSHFSPFRNSNSAIHIPEERSGLNNVLKQGRDWAIEQKADALLSVLADLPLLTAHDVKSIVELGRERGTVVLAPDRHIAGTNLMLAHPPALARFAFGRRSFGKHVTLARRAGARVETYTSVGTTLDIDTPEDLAYWESERLTPAR